ncbi:MAG TPA: YjbQ family protein [Methylovirgula sp.]
MRQSLHRLVVETQGQGLVEITAAIKERLVHVDIDEGPDDMPAHIRAALTQTQLSIPMRDGELLLGAWQGIYLFEHRRAPHRREIVLHVIGE